MRSQRFAVDDVDGTIEQANNILFDADMVEHGQAGARVEFNEDIEIAARMLFPTGNGPK